MFGIFGLLRRCGCFFLRGNLKLTAKHAALTFLELLVEGHKEVGHEESSCFLGAQNSSERGDSKSYLPFMFGPFIGAIYYPSH